MIHNISVIHVHISHLDDVGKAVFCLDEKIDKWCSHHGILYRLHYDHHSEHHVTGKAILEFENNVDFTHFILKWGLL